MRLPSRDCHDSRDDNNDNKNYESDSDASSIGSCTTKSDDEKDELSSSCRFSRLHRDRCQCIAADVAFSLGRSSWIYHKTTGGWNSTDARAYDQYCNHKENGDDDQHHEVNDGFATLLHREQQALSRRPAMWVDIQGERQQQPQGEHDFRPDPGSSFEDGEDCEDNYHIYHSSRRSNGDCDNVFLANLSLIRQPPPPRFRRSAAWPALSRIQHQRFSTPPSQHGTRTNLDRVQLILLQATAATFLPHPRSIRRTGYAEEEEEEFADQ